MTENKSGLTRACVRFRARVIEVGSGTITCKAVGGKGIFTVPSGEGTYKVREIVTIADPVRLNHVAPTHGPYLVLEP